MAWVLRRFPFASPWDHKVSPVFGGWWLFCQAEGRKRRATGWGLICGIRATEGLGLLYFAGVLVLAPLLNLLLPGRRSSEANMGRNRSRSRSYSPRRSPTPPRRKRYEDSRDRDRDRDRYRYRDRYRDRRSPAPTGLLVRNISLDARPEDLRIPFERFGPVKDVYLPKNYYTGEPRGFGFVKYRNADDAAEAKYHMNHQVIGGREITIVFAEENRKNPAEMRACARAGGRTSYRFGGGNFRRRTPPRSPRRRYRSYSRSLSPPRRGSRDQATREDNYSEGRSVSPIPRSDGESLSPQGFRSPPSQRAVSPKENGRSPTRRQMQMQACSPP